ncbi:MAG TPA: energy transducer TonB [Chthoniobacterales bacterium]|nr:energy transducer TonB [Chthoniobacterales bacterium]
MKALPNNVRLGRACLSVLVAAFCLAITLAQIKAAEPKSKKNETASATAPPDGSFGIAVVEIDRRTGKATNVTIERSSGDPRYDAAITNMLRRNKYSREGSPQLRVPFSNEAAGIFTRKDVQKYLSQHGINPDALIDAPQPRYPYLDWREGWGRYQLVVGGNGEITSVKTAQSTGVGKLDQAAIKALKKWRFRPGSVKTVLIPIHFREESGFLRILLE